jgi:hypothetical protein
MSRIAATLLTVVVALALGASTASAAGQPTPTHKHKHKSKKKHKAKKKPRPAGPTGIVYTGGLPVTVTLLDGSSATLDLGDGQPARTLPLTGGASGLIPGGYRLNRDNVVLLRAAVVKVGAGPVITDACPTPLAAVDPITALQMDRTKGNNITIHSDGTVTAAVAAALRLVLDTRAGDCAGAVSSTGFATTALTVRPAGTIIPNAGLSNLTLDSPPQPVAVSTCLTPGSPTLACSAPPATIPATLRTHLVVNVKGG